MIAESQLEEIKNVIQDCNLNFLLGSGLSSPYLSTLGNIETLLTEIESSELPTHTRQIIKCSIYKHYFDSVMAKNLEVLDAADTCMPILKEYQTFLKTLNAILLKRRNSLLGKEVNIFTTNIDVFTEKAIEDVGLEFNDGFNGRFNPSFSLSNFHKTRFKRSLHFDNVSEIPVFNVLKLHGSLTWRLQEESTIVFSPGLDHVAEATQIRFPPGTLVPIEADTTTNTLGVAADGMTPHGSIAPFIAAYEDLLIVNPTKDKFKHTILNYTYYELLRIFSNELEKDNTVLFVMGFSFADEHIREIVLRAANSNPTLLVYVIAYTPSTATEIRVRFGETSIKNANIHFIEPNNEDGDNDALFDFKTINRELFGKLFSKNAKLPTLRDEGVEQ
jgi:hypothetical protein